MARAVFEGVTWISEESRMVDLWYGKAANPAQGLDLGSAGILTSSGCLSRADRQNIERERERAGETCVVLGLAFEQV